MCLLPADGSFLQRALELARKDAAFASPNPAVGCVLSRDGQILGEGAHRYDERDHAEIVALKRAAAAGHDVLGATAYVTLEPCSHHGRTGPCADALVAAGVSRCVVATVDPNPAVRGRGLRKLQAGGITVVVADPASTIANEARRLNDAFAFAIQHGRPFVTLKSAVSRDGYLAPPPSTRGAAQPHWLTGAAARADVQRLRHEADCLITGIGTVLADNPALTDRTGEPRRRPLLRVALDSQLRLPLGSELVRSAARRGEPDLLVIASIDADREREASLQAQGVAVQRLFGSGSATELADLLAMLDLRGVRGILLEAGSAVNASFLAQNLVDQVVLYQAPVTLGEGSLPFALGQPPPDAWETRLTRCSQLRFPHGAAEDVCLSGYLHDPWAGMDGS